MNRNIELRQFHELIKLEYMSKALGDMSSCPLLHNHSINQLTQGYNQHSYSFNQQINSTIIQWFTASFIEVKI